jgi:hypothetical protein
VRVFSRRESSVGASFQCVFSGSQSSQESAHAQESAHIPQMQNILYFNSPDQNLLNLIVPNAQYFVLYLLRYKIAWVLLATIGLKTQTDSY